MKAAKEARKIFTEQRNKREADEMLKQIERVRQFVSDNKVLLSFIEDLLEETLLKADVPRVVLSKHIQYWDAVVENKAELIMYLTSLGYEIVNEDSYLVIKF